MESHVGHALQGYGLAAGWLLVDAAGDSFLRAALRHVFMVSQIGS